VAGGYGDHQNSQLTAPINQSNVLGWLNAKFLQGGATGPSGAEQPGNQGLTPTGTQVASDPTSISGLAKLLGPTGPSTVGSTGTTPDVYGSAILPDTPQAAASFAQPEPALAILNGGPGTNSPSDAIAVGPSGPIRRHRLSPSGGSLLHG
jgi:hypothetical protein